MRATASVFNKNMFKKYKWSILAGVLMGTSYIPFPPWAILFCFVPLWRDLFHETKTLKEAFIKAWWCQAVFTLIGFYWIAYVAHEFGYLPWPVALLVLLLFAAGMHLHVPIAATIGFYLGRKLKLGAPAFYATLGLSFALADQLWPGMFPFHVGYPFLWIKSPIAQWADVVGFLGLALLVHLTQAAIASLLDVKESQKRWAIAAALVIVYAGLHVSGLQRRERWLTPDRTINVLQVQANIGNLEKIFAEKGRGFQREIAQKFFTLTREGIEKGLAEGKPVDLVVWPESAYPDFLDEHNRERTYSRLFHNFHAEMKTSILTGGYSNDPPGPGKRNDYNGLFLFDGEKGAENPPYHKTHLLAYGEYVPFGETFPILYKWNPAGEGFARGPGPTVMNWRDLKIGVQICYESLYPDFSARLVEQGAHFLVNLTNDSWFGPTSEPYQHLYMTLARAVEMRRPLIRSTNTGITTAIEASGVIHGHGPLFEPWTGEFTIGITNEPGTTFYARFGGWLPVFTLLLLVLTLGLGMNTFKPKS